MILAFASADALASVRGWLLEAAAAFNIELVAVELSSEMQEEILGAQKRMRMEIATDLVSDISVEDDLQPAPE